jgi:predicted 3-demethylubiquinone-9 3-methyltransferase (glyoxalase superfamily)
MQAITTFLTFQDQAEEAVELYTSIFPNSRIVSTRRHGAGQSFIALNGGPSFSFAQGISLFVSCNTQEEVDELWERLSEGGEQGPCGWLTDKFGVSWQVIPKTLGELLNDPDPEKANRVMSAMLQMGKIEVEGLRRAYEAQ